MTQTEMIDRWLRREPVPERIGTLCATPWKLYYDGRPNSSLAIHGASGEVMLSAGRIRKKPYFVTLRQRIAKRAVVLGIPCFTPNTNSRIKVVTMVRNWLDESNTPGVEADPMPVYFAIMRMLEENYPWSHACRVMDFAGLPHTHDNKEDFMTWARAAWVIMH